MERKKARTFQDLIEWQKAHQFVLAVYRSTRQFPKKDTFRFMNIAQASLEECRYYCLLSRDLEYMDINGLMDQLEEVGKLLDAYAKSIQSSGS